MFSRNFCQKRVRVFPQLWKFSLTHFCKIFVKVTVLLNKLLKSWFHEIFFGERDFLVFPRNCENFTVTLFSQTFREINVLLKNFAVNWFDERNFAWHGSTVWKFRKFSRTKKIFREINSLVTYLVKPLLSRNFCQKSVRENFHKFHTALCTSEKFFQNILFKNSER